MKYDRMGEHLAISTMKVEALGGPLFETKVLKDGHDCFLRRYRTEDEALAGHAETIADLRSGEVAGYDR